MILTLFILGLAVAANAVPIEEWQLAGHQKKFEPAPLNHDGTVAETPDVLQAKAIHLAAYQAELAHADPNWVEPEPEYYENRHSSSAPSYDNGAPVQYSFQHSPAPVHHFSHSSAAPVHAPVSHSHPAPVQQHHTSAPVEYSPTPILRPTAGQALHHRQAYRSEPQEQYDHQPVQYVKKYEPAPLNHDGTVADTPAILQAKAIHFAAYEEAKKYASKKPLFAVASYRNKRSAHFKPAPLNHDGTVAETPEVKHAKAIHLAAVQAELAHADPHWKEPEYHHGNHHTSGDYSHDDGEYHHGPSHDDHHHQPKKHYEPAPLNHDGTVAETPAIKHAKDEFFSRYHKELSHADPHWVEPKYYDSPHHH